MLSFSLSLSLSLPLPLHISHQPPATIVLPTPHYLTWLALVSISLYICSIQKRIYSLCFSINMSTRTAHYLLLYLLCLSFHACNARRLGAVHKEPDNKFHLINKSTKAKVSDHKIPAMSMMKSFSSKPSLDQVENGESTVLQSDSINNKEPKHTKTNDDLKTIPKKIIKGSTSAPGADHPISTSKHDKSSFVSVSWRVPRKKRGVQKQPGFNLDYSPPKTHPPSHN